MRAYQVCQWSWKMKVFSFKYLKKCLVVGVFAVWAGAGSVWQERLRRLAENCKPLGRL